MSDSTIATCTEHHEGRTGRIYSSPAGLSSPQAGLTSVCTHPLTHPKQGERNLTIPNKLRDLPCWYRIPSRCTTGEWKRTAIVAARVRVYWFPFSWGSVSTHTQSPFATPSPPMGVRGRGLWRKWHWVICKWHIFLNQCRRRRDWSNSPDFTHRNIHPMVGDE